MGVDGGTGVEITTSEIKAGGSQALALAADVKTHLQAISVALASIAGALVPPSTSSYVYATTLLAAPIDTTTLKGS
jgi:hypothetical protein